MIPLAKLVEVRKRWKWWGDDGEGDSPIGKSLYEYVRVHGDEIELGELPDFTAEVTSDLRTVCWAMITRLSIDEGMLFRPEWASDEVRDTAVNAVREAIYALRHVIEVEPTRETVLECVNEVYACWKKEYRYPMERTAAVVRLINEEPDIVDAVLEPKK